MKTKAKINNNCECFFDIAIPGKLVRETLDDVYREICKHARIPGFRPGKAPRDLVEKHHGQHAQEKAFDRLIPAGYQKAVEEHKIDPIVYPEITDVNFLPDQSLLFKAKVEVRPKIKLKKYKGLKVTRSKVEVSEKEVSDLIERFRGMSAQFEPVKEARNIAKGDFTICDIEVFIDGKPISKKHENMWVEANKEASLLGVGEDLIGMKTGENKEVEKVLPENYPDKKYAGQKAVFKVLVKELKEKKLPELNDSFAKDMGAENLDKLREGLNKQLFDRKTADGKMAQQNQILEKLLKEYPVSVPPSMITRQFNVLMKRAEDEFLKNGLHKDVVAERKKDMEGSLMKDAENKVRIYFILEAISLKENITVSQAELDSKIQSIANMSRQNVDTVRNYYEKNRLIDGLYEQIREEKTLDLLLAEAEVQAQ